MDHGHGFGTRSILLGRGGHCLSGHCLSGHVDWGRGNFPSFLPSLPSATLLKILFCPTGHCGLRRARPEEGKRQGREGGETGKRQGREREETGERQGRDRGETGERQGREGDMSTREHIQCRWARHLTKTPSTWSLVNPNPNRRTLQREEREREQREQREEREENRENRENRERREREEREKRERTEREQRENRERTEREQRENRESVQYIRRGIQ